MNAVAEVSAALSALVLLAVFPAEAFFIDRPRVQRFLGIEPHGIRNVHLWSFCIGARNALAGAGTFAGLGMARFGDTATSGTGVTVVVVCCVYMVLASLFMGVADLLGLWLPHGGSLKGVLGSSVLPAIALVALAV